MKRVKSYCPTMMVRESTQRAEKYPIQPPEKFETGLAGVAELELFTDS